MARPLRWERAGARYHVTARGNERRAIFRDDTDRQHFLDRLAELPDRFGARLHAYVLMPNHYHLLVETPEANLSRLGQWLNVSYSVWFNRRHRRSGHLFQGRYAAVIIEDDPNFQAVGRYVHLNPVRVARLHLDKPARAAGRWGAGGVPGADVVKQRLEILRAWRWSSYRAYVGLAAGAPWLTMEVLQAMCGGRTPGERRRAFRHYVEEAVRQGTVVCPWERLVAGGVLGTLEFARRLRGETSIDEREQRGARELRSQASWEQIVGVVERVKGERWEGFRDRHGDWGRDLALWLGRRMGRLRLKAMGELAGGLDYATVGSAISRFDRKWKGEPGLASKLTAAKRYLSNAEM
jgi:REP element-mobilizing transposase RayT